MIRELQIGKLKLKNNLVLAPMAGYTDPPFRRMLETRPGLAFTFMVRSIPLTRGCEATLSLLDALPGEENLGAQICGNDPVRLADAAQIVEEKGFPLVDLNCGCPVKKVIKKGDGAALLREPSKIFMAIREIKKRVSLPVTLKIRSGWDSNTINAIEVARGAEDAGADALTVHGRTKEQLYRGESDLSIIEAVKRAVSIPVIGNGGLFKPEDVKNMFEKTGCDGFMIARGSFGNPWIFGDILDYFAGKPYPAQRTFDELKQALLRHITYLMEYYDERTSHLKMRKVSCWYLKYMKGCKKLRHELNCFESREEFLDHVQSFDPQVEEREIKNEIG